MQKLRKYQYLPRLFLVKKIINTLLVTYIIYHIVKPLHIILSKTSTYVKGYDGQTKWMHFLIKNDALLEKYNTIWDKVGADIKRQFDSEPVTNKKFLTTKTKSHGDEDTDFCDKEFPQGNTSLTCLAIISLYSALNKD